MPKRKSSKNKFSHEKENIRPSLPKYPRRIIDRVHELSRGNYKILALRSSKLFNRLRSHGPTGIFAEQMIEKNPVLYYAKPKKKNRLKFGLKFRCSPPRGRDRIEVASQTPSSTFSAPQIPEKTQYSTPGGSRLYLRMQGKIKNLLNPSEDQELVVLSDNPPYREVLLPTPHRADQTISTTHTKSIKIDMRSLLRASRVQRKSPRLLLKTSAKDHIREHRPQYQKHGASYEICHGIAHSLGGAAQRNNLFISTKACNTQMMVIEDFVRRASNFLNQMKQEGYKDIPIAPEGAMGPLFIF